MTRSLRRRGPSHSEKAITMFADLFAAKDPNAAAKVVDDAEPSTQRRWRSVNGAHLVALVRAGCHRREVREGVLVERPAKATQ